MIDEQNNHQFRWWFFIYFMGNNNDYDDYDDDDDDDDDVDPKFFARLAFDLFSSFKITFDPLHQFKSNFCSYPFLNLIQASRCGRGWNIWNRWSIIGAARSFSNVARSLQCCCRSLQQRDPSSGARRLSNREPSQQHHQCQRGGRGHDGYGTVARGAERSFATTQERKEAMTRLCKVCENVVTFKKWWWPQKKRGDWFLSHGTVHGWQGSIEKTEEFFFEGVAITTQKNHRDRDGKWIWAKVCLIHCV